MRNLRCVFNSAVKRRGAADSGRMELKRSGGQRLTALPARNALLSRAHNQFDSGAFFPVNGNGSERRDTYKIDSAWGEITPRDRNGFERLIGRPGANRLNFDGSGIPDDPRNSPCY